MGSEQDPKGYAKKYEITNIPPGWSVEKFQDPKHVMVPILPRFDSEGRPSCVDCAFAYIDYGGEFWTTRRMCTIDRNGSGDEPGPNCPIHSPQEQQEPL